MMPRTRLLIGMGVIALVAAALYTPFLGNALIFDDRVFFYGSGFLHGFADAAMTPFALDVRVPAYFTIAFTEVMWGRIEAHRIVSLLAHIACAWALYRLLLRLLGSASQLALAGAVIFAIHPVAVYAAGYLVQRSIVLATLFGLLSIALFLRGIDRGSHADALSAALMYWLALLCKEHAVLLPAVALLTVPLAACERRFALRHAGLYLVACAPVAVFVILLVKRLIGTPYEVDQATVIAQIDAAARTAIAGSPWLSSATTQMGLFFKYLFLWLVPSTHWMAVDMHIDFAATSSLAWSALKVLAFFAYAAAGFLLLRRGGRAAVLGFGLLYPWVLFLVELASVRFQEPFVLYRTYLWAPGIIIALATGLTYLQRRLAIALAVAAMPLLALQAADRLESFSTPLALWEDAVAKLEPGVPGGHRPLFQLGRELLYADRPGRAIAVADQCIRDYPQTAQCYLARGTIDLYYDRYDEALPYLTRAIELDPLSGIAHHHRGLVLQEFGDRNGAVAEYAEAVKHGFNAGAYRLRKLAEQEKMRSSRRD